MTEKNNETNTKDKILEEAKNLFADKGFDSTGINEIASNVGIAPSVIYYHFKNKDDILRKLIDDYLQEIISFRKEEGDKFFADPDQKEVKEINKKSVDTLFNKKLIKIILMESLKDNEEKPIFKLWEENINSLINRYGENIKGDVDKNKPKLLFKTFLMVGLPRLGYAVFIEEWCEYYNMDYEEAREIFIESTSEYYEKIMKDEFRKMNIISDNK